MASIFSDRILNFAHRGFTAKAPENSLAAFGAAIELGVDGIELDVRTCRTGEVVVFHDPTLSRMTDGRGFVKNKSLTELKGLRIRSDNSNLDERIPTLDEVIELVGDRVLLNVEIKTKGVPKNHIEAKVVEILRHFGIEDRTIISSFNPIVIRRLRKIDSNIITGYLIDKNFTVRSSEIPLSRFAGAKAIHLEKELVKERLLRKIQQLGFFTVVWSVNEPEMMKTMMQLGVDGIITDHPDQLKMLIDEYAKP